jgi:hypothetical protein
MPRSELNSPKIKSIYSNTDRNYDHNASDNNPQVSAAKKPKQTCRNYARSMYTFIEKLNAESYKCCQIFFSVHEIFFSEDLSFIIFIQIR